MDANLILESAQTLSSSGIDSNLLVEMVRQDGLVQASRLIAKGLATLSMFGAAIGEGLLIAKAMEAMGRNPEVSGSIFSKMIIGVAMAESSAIYAFVAFFII